MAQLVQHLTSKSKAQRSNSSSTKRNVWLTVLEAGKSKVRAFKLYHRMKKNKQALREEIKAEIYLFIKLPLEIANPLLR
jgi:wobble nucleotide-excising tRNase